MLRVAYTFGKVPSHAGKGRVLFEGVVTNPGVVYRQDYLHGECFMFRLLATRAPQKSLATPYAAPTRVSTRSSFETL